MSPAPSNRPTLGELAVLLNGLTGQLAEVIIRLDKADNTYERRDVAAALRQATENTVAELRTDLDAIAAQRRQLWLMLASSFALPILVGIILALVYSAKSVHP